MFGQTAADLSRQGKFAAVATLPQHCVTGQAYIKADSGGSNLYVCTAADTWTAVGIPVLGGDLAGAPSAASVKALQGRAVSGAAPGDQSVLRWNSATAQWEPAVEDDAWSAGNGIAISGKSVSVEDATIPAYYTGIGQPSINCAAGRDFYVDASGGSLYFCKAPGEWQQISAAGHTHTADAITGGTLAAGLLPAGVVWNSQANTYSAGQRQSVAHDATNAGFRLVPGPGDPANAQDGDIWYNATLGKIRRRENGLTTDWGGDPFRISMTAGTGGVTANSLCKLAGDGTVLPASGDGVLGICTNAAAGGSAVSVALFGPASCTAEGTIQQNHYVIAGSVDASRCKDSGQTSPGAISQNTVVAGRAICGMSTCATDGQTFTIEAAGPGRTGALATGGGAYLVSANAVPQDGCAAFSSGNLGSTGSPCGSGSGSGSGGTVSADSVASAIYCADFSGTANTVVCGTGAAYPASYSAGQSINVRVANTNTGPATINVAGLGAKAITKNGATPLAAGDLLAGAIYLMTYDGTAFAAEIGPPAHGATHAAGGSDPVSIDASQIASGTVPAARSAAITGDVSKSAGSGTATVAGIQGRTVAPSAPADQDVLRWNAANSQWQPGTVSAPGGSGGVTLSPGNGYIEIFPAEGTGGMSYAANTGYYFQFVLRDTIPLNTASIMLSTPSSSSHFAAAIMDANCNKIAGSDINVTGIGPGNTLATLVPQTHPLTLTPGVYYFAAAGDAAFNVQAGATWSSVYYAAQGAPRFFIGTAPSGTGATLSISSNCGTRTKITDNYRPLVYLFP